MAHRCHLHCKAGLTYGWGHLVRATTLADFLRRQGDTWRVTLAVEGEPACRGFLDRRGFADALVFASDDGAEARLLDADPPDLVIVDMLEPSRELLARHGRAGRKVLAFSDTGIAHEAADLVICPNLEEVWAASRGPRMMGGLDYVVVPEAITAAARSRGPEPAQARRLFVNMGGSVSWPVFAAVSEVLVRLADHGFHGCFLLGYDRDFEIPTDLVRRLAAFTLMDGTDEIARLLSEAELGFTAAGYMRYEAAAAGLPAVLVSLVDHQHRFGELFAARGLAAYGGPIRETAPAHLAQQIVALADDRSSRAAFSATGRRLLDGQALSRIAEAALRLAGS